MDITSLVTLPVWIMEPYTILQKVAEIMEYTELLDTAASTEDPYERSAHVTAQLELVVIRRPGPRIAPTDALGRAAAMETNPSARNTSGSTPCSIVGNDGLQQHAAARSWCLACTDPCHLNRCRMRIGIRRCVGGEIELEAVLSTPQSVQAGMGGRLLHRALWRQ